MPRKKSVKIAIPSVGEDLDAQIDPRFGRCQYFLILNEKGELLKSIPNQGCGAMRGAGTNAAQLVADQRINVVIAGNVGPNAYGLLNASGIKIFAGAAGMTVKKAFDAYKKGKLKEVEPSTGYGFGPGFGQGMGRGQRPGPGRGRRGR